MAVVSRGDEVLLQLGRRKGVHFPQDEDGKWAGFHPSDSESAVEMLEQAREEGAEYFLLPSTSFWWLDYYQGLKTHLETRYQVVEAGDSCWIVQLTPGMDLAAHSVPAPSADTERMTVGLSLHESSPSLREVIDGLLPEGAKVGLLSTGGAGTPAGLLQADLADPEAAIDQLHNLETDGTQFVVVPGMLFDWLADNPEVRQQLNRHRFITKQAHLCEIYELLPATEERPPRESEETGTTRTSFGEVLRRILLRSRRHGTGS